MVPLYMENQLNVTPPPPPPPPPPPHMTERKPNPSDADAPSVSIIIPARNAEAVIGNALDSILSQDYAGPMEVVVADGSDTPVMSELIWRSYPTVRVVPNPEQTTGFGANAAIRAATGEIIVRCDAHTTFPPGYVRRAVNTLERTGAANVGGRQWPIGITFFERAVALAMIIPLGAGNARYRLGGTEGPVDTVFLGVFRREDLDEVGGYDSTLIRNQDYELNWRLRKCGKIVWFDPELAATYRPRSTLRALAQQYFDYGRWKRVMLRRHPRSMRARHLAAPLLVLALAASPVLALAGSLWLAAAPVFAYVLTVVAGAAAVGLGCRDTVATLLPLVLPTIHLSWGIGFFLPPRLQGD